MTYNKLVIRRLPPSLSEDEFLNQVGPLANHDYFCFFEASPGLGRYSFSRAYINFISQDDMLAFVKKFDNYKFSDKNGREYPAVVEQAFWHKSSTSGPFYTAKDQTDESCLSSEKIEKKQAAIEQDQGYLEFVERLESQKHRSQQSPIQTIENNLDELTNATTSKSPGKSKKITTPLLEHVNQARILKNNKKSK